MNIQTVTFNKLSFISVTTPGELEIKYLKNNYEFDTLHLDDHKYKTQVPKIETFKNYTLVVLDFPYFRDAADQPAIKTPDKETQKQNGSSLFSLPSVSSVVSNPFSTPAKRSRISSTQVYFFVGKDYLVVLHEGVLGPINDIFAQCQKALKNRNDLMGQGPTFLLYKILDTLVDSFFPLMNDISSTIDKIDKDLEKYSTHDTIEEISISRRNLVLLHTIFKPALPLFLGLEAGKYSELNGSMTPYWGNVYDHMLKLWDRLEDSRELLVGIAESNESLLSYRNNELVKFFTVITSISFPFIIVNNLYSMNVANLPFAQSHWIIWILFGIILAGGVLIILYFKYRKWL